MTGNEILSEYRSLDHDRIITAEKRLSHARGPAYRLVSITTFTSKKALQDAFNAAVPKTKKWVDG